MSVRLLTRMTGRDPEEAHRASTPLELFFDLTFVVAIAQLASSMHHELVEGHAGDALIRYPLVFFAVWWGWMNFTWFASAFDTDDALYRVTTLVQMAGVLVIAAGVPQYLEDDGNGTIVVGYLIMRVGLLSQWLRAAAQHPGCRPAALQYVAGIAACQLGWIALWFAPDGWWIPGAIVLGTCELVVPAWAERDVRTSWHPGHIAERYGLFTIIVLGESVLSATVAVQVALDAGEHLSDLLTVVVGGIVLVSAMWWIYFDMPVERVLERSRHALTNRDAYGSFVWGYGHIVVFASAAAAGIGVAVAVDQATHHSELTDVQAGLTVAVPVAVYLLSIWALHRRAKGRTVGPVVAAALVLATAWTPEPVLLSGLVVAGLVAVHVLRAHRLDHDLGGDGLEAGAEEGPQGRGVAGGDGGEDRVAGGHQPEGVGQQ